MDVRRKLSALLFAAAFFLPGCEWANLGSPARTEKLPPPEPPIEIAESQQLTPTPLDEPAHADGPPSAEYAQVDDWLKQFEMRRRERTPVDRPPSDADTVGAARPAEPDNENPDAAATPREPETAAAQAAAPAVSVAPPQHATDTAAPAAANAARAPVLQSVTVQPVRPKPAPVTGGADERAVANRAQSAVDTAPSLEALLAEWSSMRKDAPFDAQLDQRVLAVLAGNYELARRPIDLASADQQAMARHIIETLITIRDGRGGNPSSEARQVLGELDALYEALAPVADLSIPKLELCRSVRGFGQYSPADTSAFRSGAPIEFVVYIEVRDFATSLRSDGEFEAQFSLKTTVHAASGGIVLEIDDPDIRDHCRTRRRDCFIPRLVRLPATLAPGEYVVKVSLADKIGKKVAEARTTIQLSARS